MLRMSVKLLDGLLIVSADLFAAPSPAIRHILTKGVFLLDLVTFLGQELSANAKIDMDKDKDKIEKVSSGLL
jgi:hypothetical protein